ncbi:MAG: rhomboid family intramembrane serine protease [Gemmatimonadota bacterium]|nr:rhomboid family intramembrane serine protease [Gemmatimonadota bacterium]
MVMPLRDDDTDRRTVPIVTYALIAVNILIWLIELARGEKFINGYSTVPFEITHDTDLVGIQTIHAGGQNIPIHLYPGPTPIYLTLLFSMFMHASWLHIGGNMLYLWIFGDNIEDRIGHVKFLVFYLICGLAASAADILFKTDSIIPSLGASGAIAGVLGAYLVLFPKRKVKVLMARQVVNMPAFMVLGLWILLQIFSQISVVGGEAGGVAYMAHIGGFVAGVALIFLLGGRRAPPPREVLPGGMASGSGPAGGGLPLG